MLKQIHQKKYKKFAFNCAMLRMTIIKSNKMDESTVSPVLPKKSTQQSSFTQTNTERIFFDLLEKVGTSGRYQKVTLIFWSIACYLCGGLSMITPFLFFQDPYSCSSAPESLSCKDYVCTLSTDQRMDFLSSPTMTTLADKMGDYRCSGESATLSLAILFMYLSIIFAFLILTVFGDYFGRKKVIVAGLITMLIGLVVTLLAPSLAIAIVGMFIAMTGVQWAFSVSFLFISETVAESHRQKFLVIVQFFYGLGNLGNTGLFYWLRDWQEVFIYSYIIPGVILLIGIMIIVVDTPMSLVKKLSSEEVFQKLLWISKINGIESPKLKLQDISLVKEMQNIKQSKQKQSKHFTCIDLFRYPSLRTMTILLIVLQFVINFLFYAPTLMLADFQFSIFLNGAVIGSASAVSYIFSYFTVSHIKRKTMAVISFGVIFIVSFVLIFVWDPNSQTLEVSANIAILISFFVITLVITTEYTFYYVYITELFPTQARMVGFSMITVSGGVTIALSDLMITLSSNAGFSVMIIFAAFALINLVASCCLPQTLGSPAPDIIQELSQKVIPADADKKEGKYKGIYEGKVASLSEILDSTDGDSRKSQSQNQKRPSNAT